MTTTTTTAYVRHPISYVAEANDQMRIPAYLYVPAGVHDGVEAKAPCVVGKRCVARLFPCIASFKFCCNHPPPTPTAPHHPAPAPRRTKVTVPMK